MTDLNGCTSKFDMFFSISDFQSAKISPRMLNELDLHMHVGFSPFSLFFSNMIFGHLYFYLFIFIIIIHVPWEFILYIFKRQIYYYLLTFYLARGKT